MDCKYCGAQLRRHGIYCLSCGGKNNAEEGEAPTEKQKVLGMTLSTIICIASVIVVVAAASAAALIHTLYIYLTPSMSASTYNECISVSFSASDKEAELYLSQDGDDFIPYYGTDFWLNQSRTYTFSLYAVNSYGNQCEVRTYEYVMDIDVPKSPEPDLQPGEYEGKQIVRIFSEGDEEIYYTLDGSEPNEYSYIYDDYISLDIGTTTISARGKNGIGTWGEVCMWTYTINPGVPAKVNFSREGGVYHNDGMRLFLSHDEECDIYYTVDGSDPTVDSYLYTSTIDIPIGVTTIKALAVNGYNIMSEIAEQTYVVTYNQYNAHPRSAVTANACYVLTNDGNSMLKLDENMNMVREYKLDGFTTIYSDGVSIYGISSSKSGLYKFDTDTEEFEQIISGEISEFALAFDKIYYVSSGELYTADMDGSNEKLNGDFIHCSICGFWESKLYLLDSDVIYTISSEDEEPEVEITGYYYGAFFHDYINFASFSLYFVADQGLRYLEPYEQTVSTIIESYSGESTIASTSTFEVKRIEKRNCDKLIACHNTLYARITTNSILSEYNVSTQQTKETLDTSYTWYAINLNNNNITNTSITTEHISVLDHCIIDDEGEVYMTENWDW